MFFSIKDVAYLLSRILQHHICSQIHTKRRLHLNYRMLLSKVLKNGRKVSHFARFLKNFCFALRAQLQNCMSRMLIYIKPSCTYFLSNYNSYGTYFSYIAYNLYSVCNLYIRQNCTPYFSITASISDRFSIGTFESITQKCCV